MSEQAKILIVDDDRDLVESLTLVLEHEGYEVVSAYDAAARAALGRRRNGPT